MGESGKWHFWGQKCLLGGRSWNHLNGLFGHWIPSLNTKSLLREGIKCPKSPFKWFQERPPKRHFWPQTCHFPDFPILTSVGGPLDRKTSARPLHRKGGKAGLGVGEKETSKAIHKGKEDSDRPLTGLVAQPLDPSYRARGYRTYVFQVSQGLSGTPARVPLARYSYSYSLSPYVFQVSHPIALYPPKLAYRRCCPVSKAVTASCTRRPMTPLHSHTQVACRGGYSAIALQAQQIGWRWGIAFLAAEMLAL